MIWRYVRQAKPGKGGSDVVTETFHGTQQVCACPAETSDQPEPSVAWWEEQSPLRSVHRKCAGRVMEPRKQIGVAGADTVYCVEGRAAGVVGSTQRDAPVPPGSESGACARGSPRNLGGPLVSGARTYEVAPRRNARLGAVALRSSESEQRAQDGTASRRERSDGGRMSGRRSSS